MGATTACDRPVGGRDLAKTSVRDLRVSPEVIRAGVPVTMTFTLVGTPARVSYDIAGHTFACNPTAGDDRRHRCVHPGVDATELQEGPAQIALSVFDAADRSDTVSAAIELDFTCPRLVSIALSTPIAAVDEDVVVSAETSERLTSAPIVSRLGRRWEEAAGDGRSFAVTHRVDAMDAGGFGDVLVRLTDRAGNTSADCGGDGRASLAVDHTPPVANIHDVELVRGAPGEGTTIRGGAGAFLDDVGIDHVRILDPAGSDLIATLAPEPDGSLKRTALPGLTNERVTLQAIDRFGRASAPVSIREKWRLSLGTAATPGASVKTAVRLTAPPPSNTSMHVQTAELSPALIDADTRSVVVTAPLGMQKILELSARYETTSHIPAAYDVAGKAAVLVGGYQGNLYAGGGRPWANWLTEVTILRWDELAGTYRIERGPSMSRDDPTAPVPLYARDTLDFDRSGCAILSGGFRIDYTTNLWRLCGSPAGYRWSQLEGIAARGAQVVYDPTHHRWISLENDGLFALLPHSGTEGWRWREIPVPSMYENRGQQLGYWDPKQEALVTGMWGMHMLTYRENRWQVATVDFARRSPWYVGHAYDVAREQLVTWGGGRFPDSQPLAQVYFQTASSTSAATAWTASSFTTPLARMDPVLIYDQHRETTLMFGGVRPIDGRPIAPDVYELTAQPSFPYALVDIDLLTDRPKGVSRLHLDVRAAGLGDIDGMGPLEDSAGGFAVLLWDTDAGHWEEVAAHAHAATAAMSTLAIDVTDGPARFISADGVVSIALRPLAHSTESVDGRLEIDLIDGYLELACCVDLP